MLRSKMMARMAVCAGLLLASGCGKDPEVAKRELVQSGDAYVAEDKFPEAVIQYRNAVQVDPRFGEARKKLAQAYRRTGDLTNAYREAVRAADLLPNDIDAQVEAGQLLLLARQFEDAKSRGEKALALNPKHVEALILHANALAGLNRLEDALTEVEAAIREEPDRTTSYAVLGAIQVGLGQSQEAEVAFKRAIEVAPTSVDARLALVNYYWTSGRRSEAEVELKEALVLDPKNVLANRALALFYVGARQFEQAEPYLRTLADELPNTAGKLVLADYYMAMQRREEARRILEEIAASGEEGTVNAKLRLAGLGLGSGNPAEALRLIDEVLSSEPRNWHALLAKMQTLLRMGEFEDAFAAVRAAAQANPQSSETQFALGRVYVLRGQRQEALEAFTTALRLNPRMATAEFEIAQLHLQANQLDQAEQFAQAAISKLNGYVNAHLLVARIRLMRGEVSRAEPTVRALARYLPDLPPVQAQLGQLERLKNNRAAARAAFSKALAGNPAQLDAIAGLVAMDLDEKRTDAARARVDEAVRASPTDVGVLLMAARTYETLGDFTSTERLARQAVAASPSNLDAYAMLGNVYIRQRRIDDAIRQFTEVAERNPNSIVAHTVIGMLLQAENKPAEARARYEKALGADPRAAVAANNLAWIHMETGGNLDIALQLARTAKAGLPDRPEADDTLGWAFYMRGQYSQALGPLLESISKNPANPTYHYHLGLVYAALEQRDKAREALEKSLTLRESGADADDARRALADLKS